MSRLLPRSLFGQTLLILLAGLIASYAVGFWIFTADREQAVRAVGGFATAQRIANLTRLVQDTPLDARQRIVASLSDQTFRVTLSARPPASQPGDSDTAAAQAIREFLSDQLELGSARQPRVSASTREGPGFGPWHAMGHGPMMMHGFGEVAGFGDLQVSIPLTDGSWLSFATTLPAGGPAFSAQFLLSMAIMALIILGVSVWAVRRVTAPLASLASAAERLGRNVNAAPLQETGTSETRQAARAFNDMQARLRGLIENRTRLLAAISHDLRTPLTLLRLRAETMENGAERDKMLANIAEMDAMIGATLMFARDQNADEAKRLTDITSLLQSVVNDMRDAGFAVQMRESKSIVYECQPAALKRAIRNLLDNAVKYGKSGTVEIRRLPKAIEIDIDDEGPGVPQQELTRVLEPFYRLDESRSRETGGVGLGLAIAQSIVQSHGGSLRLSNRPTGGLRAAIVLPA
ncbi:MAG TPA: ATP-binding protein [Hyphomicrobiaceae bacterium]|jgi:signal transduction histidine kinase|nr:ATP-binding protein [Hyphomicrobiaceae bacterium]